MCCCTILYRNMSKVKIIVLNATGRAEEMESLLPGRKFIEIRANVFCPGKKIHLKYALGKESVCGNDNKKKPMKDEHIRSKLKDAIKFLGEDETRVLIVTFMAAKEKVLKIASELDPGRRFEVIHFWGNRGLNKFEDCDAVIAFGTPTANPLGLKDHAAALFEDIEAQNQWIAEQGLSELFQSVHRIRPIYSAKTIIIMGQHWPDQLGCPDIKIDRYKPEGNLDAAVKRLLPILKQLGFLHREIACLAGVFCRQDSDVMQEWIENRKTLLEKVPFPIRNIFIGNGTFSDPLFEPLILKRSSSWDQLVSLLMFESGLPELKIKQLFGPGKPSRGVGTIAAARRFNGMIGLDFDESIWEGVETTAWQCEERMIRRRTLQPPSVLGAFKSKSVIETCNLSRSCQTESAQQASVLG